MSDTARAAALLIQSRSPGLCRKSASAAAVFNAVCFGAVPPLLVRSSPLRSSLQVSPLRAAAHFTYYAQRGQGRVCCVRRTLKAGRHGADAVLHCCNILSHTELYPPLLRQCPFSLSFRLGLPRQINNSIIFFIFLYKSFQVIDISGFLALPPIAPP